MPIKKPSEKGSNGIPHQPVDDIEGVKEEVANGVEPTKKEPKPNVLDRSETVAEVESKEEPATIDDVSKLDDTGNYVFPVLMRGSMIKDIDTLRGRGDYTDGGEVVRDLVRYGLRRIQPPKSNNGLDV